MAILQWIASLSLLLLLTVMDIAAVVVIIVSFGYLEVIWPGGKPQTLSAPHQSPPMLVSHLALRNCHHQWVTSSNCSTVWPTLYFAHLSRVSSTYPQCHREWQASRICSSAYLRLHLIASFHSSTTLSIHNLGPCLFWSIPFVLAPSCYPLNLFVISITWAVSISP